MKEFFTDWWKEIDFFKKSKWRNLLNNPISNNLGTYILFFIIGIFSYKTYKLSNDYFEKNELNNKISYKFNTNDSITISEQDEVFEIISIYDTVEQKHKTLSLNKGNNILINENSQPLKYKIERSEKESFGLGDIGDFIGGYFGFWLGIIGALLTFLAFYIQYKANKEVQKQFRLQQFETQFHKMIDVYLNNKDKFSIVGYKNPKNIEVIIKGKNLKEKCDFKNNNLFTYLTKNNKIEFIDYVTRDHIVFQKFLVELKVVYRVFLEAFKEINNKKEEELSTEEKKKIFIEAYKLFFNGLNKYQKDKKDKNEISEYEKLAIFSIKKIRDKHRKDGSKKFKDFYIGKGGENKTLWVKLNYEPFKGYLHFLPQYYRNLYSIVKFVINSNDDLNLNDKTKLEYLKILRSTMSDYEQTLLFYNWYSEKGNSWEDENNKFFTKFKMIHNLKKITLIDDDIDVFKILNIPENKQESFFEKYID